MQKPMYDSLSLPADNHMDLVEVSIGSERVRFQAIKEHLFSMLGAGSAILSMKNGKYYTLNSVGSSIWKVIREPANLQEIESAVLGEYDVDPTKCRREIVLFLKTMVAEDLIMMIDE